MADRSLPASSSTPVPAKAVCLCGLLAALVLHAAAADIPSPPPDPFKVVEHRSGSTWTQVTLEDGDIGEIDLDEIARGDLTSIVELLQNHSEWTDAASDIELELVTVFVRGAVYRQRVHGVPVSRRGSVEYDDHGHVTRLQSILMHPGSVVAEPTIPVHDAVAIGKDRFRDYLGREEVEILVLPVPGTEQQADPPTLYLQVPLNQDAAPDFVWHMTLTTADDAATRYVLVDARSGSSNVIRRAPD